MIKLSIITINFNNAIGLQKTIDSVINQTFSDFEYIIIDGSSSDGSKELIEVYKNKLAYWVSEPDNGIYNAMNKGIKVAKGEYLLFLNSGDWLANNHVLSDISKMTENRDIIYGDWYLSYSDGRVIEEKFPDIISFYFLAWQYSLPHQASLIKREFLIKHGCYDESLKMVSDWKFYLEAIFSWQCSYKHLPIFFCYYDKQGFSSDTRNNEIQHSERQMVLTSSFPNMFYNKNEAEKVLMIERSKKIKILRKIGFLPF